MEGGGKPMLAKPWSVITSERPVGPRASAAWLAARGLEVRPRWQVAITLDTRSPRDAGTVYDTSLHIAIDADEWGVVFSHGSGMSWVRVIDAPTIQDRDDYNLVAALPPLHRLGVLVQSLEDRFQVRFRRQHATIRTNLRNADQKIVLWVVAAL